MRCILRLQNIMKSCEKMTFPLLLVEILICFGWGRKCLPCTWRRVMRCILRLQNFPTILKPTLPVNPRLNRGIEKIISRGTRVKPITPTEK